VAGKQRSACPSTVPGRISTQFSVSRQAPGGLLLQFLNNDPTCRSRARRSGIRPCRPPDDRPDPGNSCRTSGVRASRTHMGMRAEATPRTSSRFFPVG
jgi:hypothetical protein